MPSLVLFDANSTEVYLFKGWSSYFKCHVDSIGLYPALIKSEKFVFRVFVIESALSVNDFHGELLMVEVWFGLGVVKQWEWYFFDIVKYPL